jgi:hypothetical protein
VIDGDGDGEPGPYFGHRLSQHFKRCDIRSTNGEEGANALVVCRYRADERLKPGDRGRAPVNP